MKNNASRQGGDRQGLAIGLAVLAAALYAVSTPVSKMLLAAVPPTMVAAWLYLGAGLGMGGMMLGRKAIRHHGVEQPLRRKLRLK